MAKMLLVDSLKELRTIIDQQHLLYLEFDENPQKIEQRLKLEGYIKEYLCLAPHNNKFTFQETAEVLHQSASTNSSFSAYKAAVAWKAIGKYADNLISHPWRKEYRNIKLYCGFYKHEIEESLVGAEHMFEVMGYRHAGQSTLVLQGILDPDRITSVSKDAIMAYVECQIMKQIWETLSAQFHITWLEILEFRENHIGTPDQVINTLVHKYSQRQYQEKVYHRPSQSLENHMPPPECLYRHGSMGYFGQMPYPTHSYPAPIQARYGPGIPPQQMMSTSAIYSPQIQPNYVSSHHILKPHDLYPVNGHHRHYSSQMNLPTYNHNYQLNSPMYPAPSVVPTGQLIEFDSAPAYNGSEPHFQRSNAFKYNCSPEELLYHQSMANSDEPSLSGKAKDDGAGSWENWDYVYRNLETQGYKKTNNELTPDLTLKSNHQSSSQNNSSEIDSLIQTDFPDKVRKINLDRSDKGERSSSRSCTDGSDESRAKVLKEKLKIDIDKSRTHGKCKTEARPAKTSPEKGKKAEQFESVGGSESAASTNTAPACSKVNLNQKKEETEPPTSTKDNAKAKKLRDGMKPLVVNLNEVEDEDKWQCVTCTYLNAPEKNVCDMCSKSRERGHEINPQPTGGQECYKCTLINKPGLNYCSACNAFLKDSPTYI